jgi:hypothetical protein
MALPHRKACFFIPALAAAIALTTMPLWGDTRHGGSSTMPKFSCYCECEKGEGHPMCPMKMCEIPKYEKRWWANSCHKQSGQSSTAKPGAPASQPNAHHSHSMQSAKK